MRSFRILATWTSAWVLTCLATQSFAYFIITEPKAGTQWKNGAANPVIWEKGVLDGIAGFDMEITRLSGNGLTLVARNVPAKSKAMNVLVQDLPAADDYFILFMNATHGITHATSARFAILPASGTASKDSEAQQPVASATTVTVSGAPDPTRPFATTFPALNNGAVPLLFGAQEGAAWGLLGAVVACVAGATWTLW